ncbi:MAG: OsmC family peroxiredoxin [Gemmatimonadales bacterium]|nr:OsmC family peroxiredoxin [Gemmatimonadales bacterium]NIN12859.1 OsmC family peroxiredoxin [Gemmatimonadales bacterium]NIN51037.1 OsmC family peroxiredoxin [Gemmatimonadales bacterium]NIP08501.1 OsmC family peroxiredoxin [Gemmatimonadales bacterium]NIR02541.1 OsmC family peroxiredoxin [Gemmatimonadales bacterium]
MTQVRSVRLDWSGEGLQFTGGGLSPQTPALEIDGDGSAAPSPMLALLLACAGCSGADVVVILRKMRVKLRSLAVEVQGTRRDQEPRRYVTIRFRYRMAGDGLDRGKAERAVALSLDKYCSVVHSLAPDIAVDYDIELA